ncbi:probable protein phosphatase 2C 48 isoform X2 [Triticum dicoccoides]|uniref:probable protein phosphatase 2C 48 isoform X2 n=1 Tax=Triticum dicoccoides TaxID=85692 RepID=UPI00188E1ABA|nr:probable protein phosphatase 2C 48 isoform X2 [Triticum dicoccoides]
MRQLSSLLQGLARSMAGKERKEDDPQGTVLRSSGTLRGEGSETLAAVWSRRGEKGTNQDCSLVWEDDTIFCGIFDGHGQWGHYVSKAVRDSLPPSLLRHWQEAVALASLIDGEKKLGDCQFDLWRQSYLAAAAAVDEELRRSRRLDAVNSGSTALSIVKKGDTMVIANVGDSRAVLGTTSDDGSIAAVQLTVDFKPNLPQEKARIVQCKGRVHCHDDEPGVHRVWLPDREAPGLAMSRAFGDYCVKDYGVISAPEVTQRRITSRDQFVILATDGVRDVVSNEEAVQIVADTPEREKAAKRLVQCAVRAWRRKRRGYAVDDCSAICLFLHPPPS